MQIKWGDGPVGGNWEEVSRARELLYRKMRET